MCIGWFSERQRSTKAIADLKAEPLKMAEEYDDKSYKLVDGLITFQSAADLIDRISWTKKKFDPPRVTNDRICKTVISLWTHHESVGSAMDAKTNGMNKKIGQDIFPQMGETFAQDLTGMIFKTAEINTIERFEKMLKSYVPDNPLAQGFFFDPSKTDAEDYKNLIEFASTALQNNEPEMRNSHRSGQLRARLD